jgi:hypothetical protein
VRPSRPGIVVSTIVRACVLTGMSLLCCLPHRASDRHRGAIICREELSVARREQLAGKLRIITGWPRLTFDEGGRLRLGVDQPVAGSRTARALITKALSDDKIFILEDASNRSDVVFSRIVPGRWKNVTDEKLPVFVVLIDFADFDHLMGDPQALAAFDVGWGLLHEIDHAANDSADAETLGQTGECEGHINQMRRECNLPQRVDYFFRFYPHANESAFTTRFVRLAFDQEKTNSGKHRRYWLIWDATLVGGLELTRQVVALR